MKIQILPLIAGARAATGLTVVIDVFRAFSTACYVFANGAEKIIPVGDINIAYKLKKENPDYILMGERGGKIQPGFDFGNSPTIIEHVNFTGKTIVQTTSAGTQGITNAQNADDIITGSFVNAGAVIKYILQRQPEVVSLVPMGSAGITLNDEDLLCAQFLQNTLENKPVDFDSIVAHLRNYESARKFFDPQIDWAPERDFALCLSVNRFDFILHVEHTAANFALFRKGNIRG